MLTLRRGLHFDICATGSRRPQQQIEKMCPRFFLYVSSFFLIRTHIRITNNPNCVMKILLFILVLSLPITFTSCGVFDPGNFSHVQSAAQQYSQSQRGGTYVGKASTQAEAKSIAQRAGFPYYQWYPSTGRCYGYKHK